MYHLVYTSIATNSFSEAELIRLLEKSRATNKGLAISGSVAVFARQIHSSAGR
ncbi:MAG: BLUF domain-containing protein [Cyclobacteriaceae bacterium]|jgi:hypothetical protein